MDTKNVILELKNVSKTFNEKTIFSNVNLKIIEGNVVGIIGESGIGKSTLLKIIDREIEGDSISEIELNGDKSILIPQHPALWDNLNVLQNVSIVRQLIHHENKRVANNKAAEYLQKLRIHTETFKRFPNTLSGGEKQRVSIARGLASEIKFILFDEVTSNIDPENKSIVTDLINHLSKNGFTIIFVTHDLFTLRKLNCDVFKLERKNLTKINQYGNW